MIVQNNSTTGNVTSGIFVAQMCCIECKISFASVVHYTYHEQLCTTLSLSFGSEFIAIFPLLWNLKHTVLDFLPVLEIYIYPDNLWPTTLVKVILTLDSHS